VTAWDLAPRLAGRLVVLEPLAERHYEGLLNGSGHPEIWEWWPLDPTLDFRAWFDGALAARAAGTDFHFATLDAGSGVPLGSTSFTTPKPADRGIEIGWTWLTPAAWGTGANIEAKLLQLTYAFEQLQCIRVEFDTDELNSRSRRALAALPAQFEGVLRDWNILPNGRRASSAYYSILDHEWPAVRANLSARLGRHA
jgi:RimJ/RimL family protein N-acetyltransferase